MSARQVGFWAAGVPIPQGSKRIGRAGRKGRPLLIDANDDVLKPWRDVVARAAREAMAGAAALNVPVDVSLVFYMPRPGGHYRADGVTLRPSAPAWPAVKPDVDKLERAVFDGMTAGGLWVDDSRAVVVRKVKKYADLPHQAGVAVMAAEILEGEAL